MTAQAFPSDQWFAACPKGLEGLLAAELTTLGAVATRETVAGVYFGGPLATAYRACLWSRLANRVLLPIARLASPDSDSLYAGLKTVDWSACFGPKQSFAIDFSGQNKHIRNTQFGAQRSKDAIVDWFVAHCGQRPPVARKDPDIRLNIRLAGSEAVLSLDFSGGSLHQRGYRLRAGAAPLKENLAAAILLRADWPAIAARGGALVDPMCGSATLLLEGAMMAADIAPGLQRERFGFEHWAGHNAPQWQAVLADARGRAARGRAATLPEIRGYDADPKVLRSARDNIARIGLEKVVRVSSKPLSELKKPSHKPLPIGLLVCNPPYGERLGERDSLMYLYRQLGEVMAAEFGGWQAALLTSDLELGKATGLRSHKRYALWNGPIAAHLLLFNLTDNELRGSPTPESAREADPDTASDQPPLSDGARMFANRLRKNRKRLRAWVQREQVSCYRLYDADMPEYAVAVDIYGECAHVAEYQAPAGVDPAAAERRMQEVRTAVPDALGLPATAIAYKQRRRQRGGEQYQKQASRGEFISVTEGAARLLVNLHDYLDTGLFLDHRPLRRRLFAEAAGRDFLNLFCYTGAATVHAALGGARTTTSVDLSNTYLGWARKNLAHNGLDETRNLLQRANCLQWLQQADRDYDLVLLDPPSFSNSSAMAGSFDVQRDHPELVRAAMALLRPDGVLYFSNNRRGFGLDAQLLADFACEDITAQTLDPDFQRNSRIHCCWLIRHRPSESVWPQDRKRAGARRQRARRA
ncbi:MAG: bifunctional 23S rRNA (guanine(2069)-N(7))-methyltransferase RlmK/23S rRNA (guanine(2445)-N(2))-methyltransferase RlmL [Pseudomonadales bacterium]|nr:bifunctional 23S rRNA (guanine(2069)-N(7))-methyltransferase RlmK/23S rRNA (guanine(2445)-N(2))-methyltransferase RlmL [Halieaceae bacterium]MCP5163975.1 bifunctional 23S rRNA (guanine(2069)-N(7))-methyltransferase RlmK/23S rRNA (guanine(2445)-N(2))-methyltransferase RlmL [Pseudomonadales bacterium]MCP5188989.1 bifunctional 23S rRNA (guanine(2069)-N(7))-methyltransferase RlmK/23S rRNA (guanine(2445)-N(2))-methyltransferase RlmL [Pseudomonadales bacterium]MCP5203024.1 bifunctional 23S rRNA (gu